MTDALAARNPLSPRRRRWVTTGLLLGVFLAAVEQTVVATAMPTLVASLGGLNIYSWVFSAYLLASTVSVPLWGRFADLYGRKPYYLSSIGLFLFGSILAGQSQSMEFLVFARLIQGLGAGGIFPIGSTILSDIYSLEQRARIQGIFSSVWGFASMAGPLAGGLITDLFSWRWVFYVNVPFGLGAIFVVYRALTEPAKPQPSHRIDVKGILALSASVSCLLIATTRIGDGTTDAMTAVLVLATIASIAAFVRLERSAKEPIMPPSLFANRVFRVASIIGLFAGMGLFGAISFVPLFVQGVLFGSATAAGTTLTPLMLSWVMVSSMSGWMILRFSYRPLVIIGMGSFVLGFALLMQLGASSSYVLIYVAMVALGLGMGASMVTMLLGVQNSVKSALVATATSATVFFRTIGGAVGVAIMGAVLSHRLSVRSAATTDSELVALAARPDAIVQEAARESIDPAAIEWLRQGLVEGLHGVFWAGLLIATIAFALSFRFPGGSAKALAEARETAGA